MHVEVAKQLKRLKVLINWLYLDCDIECKTSVMSNQICGAQPLECVPACASSHLGLSDCMLAKLASTDSLNCIWW